MSYQEPQRHLTRGCLVRGRDLLQDAPARCLRPGKAPVTERAVGHDGDVVALAPGEHAVLDGPLIEMVEDLIAGQPAIAGDLPDLFEVRHVEVAHSPGEDLSLLP